MARLVHLPPEARRRQRREARRKAEAVAAGTSDPIDLTAALFKRYRDLQHDRMEMQAEAKDLAEEWRKDARRYHAEGNERRSRFCYLAADALEGWATKTLSPTTIWPGL